jgi:restriction system protein
MKAAQAAAREAERKQRAAAREHMASIRRAETARKGEERARVMASRAAEADRKRLEKEAKAAHVVSMEAEVAERNSELASTYDDIDNLLAATLDVDDYVDLESLRRTTDSHPFDRIDLLTPTPPFVPKPLPKEPNLRLPDPPKGFFGRKKKHAKAVELATASHAETHAAWRIEVAELQAERKAGEEKHVKDERQRIAKLEHEQARFAAEINEHNATIDTFVTNLSYGTPEAVQEYVSIVVSNSVYPAHFPVNHDFTFESATAELRMRVLLPPPSEIPGIKSYKYVKASDEIKTAQLSLREQKSRYAGAINQVAIRSIHEIFEADRRGIVKTISVEVGTETVVPATGRTSYIPLVAVATSRDTFIDFDLSRAVPAATLKHLGAAISKDPFGLVEVDTTGIRRS